MYFLIGRRSTIRNGRSPSRPEAGDKLNKSVRRYIMIYLLTANRCPANMKALKVKSVSCRGNTPGGVNELLDKENGVRSTPFLKPPASSLRPIPLPYTVGRRLVINLDALAGLAPLRDDVLVHHQDCEVAFDLDLAGHECRLRVELTLRDCGGCLVVALDRDVGAFE